MIEDAETTGGETTDAAVATPVAEILPAEESLSTKALVALDPEARAALERRDAGSYVFDPSAFALAQQVAKSMAASALLPQHLRARTGAETIANCMFLVADAMRWRVSPHAPMAECYPRPGGGGLAHQGKAIAVVVNKCLNVHLNYRYSGAGEDRACAAFATTTGESAERTTPPVIYRRAVTRNRDGTPKAAWTNDPDQKLSYNAATKWARQHAPELVTGVITADEADAMAEERRATMPATPTPGEPPASLRRFVEETEPHQEAPIPDDRPTIPPSAGEPPGATPEPAPRRSIVELQKLAKENHLQLEDLEKLCRAVTEGRRGLAQLWATDCGPLVQEILRTGKDRKRGA